MKALLSKRCAQNIDRNLSLLSQYFSAPKSENLKRHNRKFNRRATNT